MIEKPDQRQTLISSKSPHLVAAFYPPSRPSKLKLVACDP